MKKLTLLAILAFCEIFIFSGLSFSDPDYSGQIFFVGSDGPGLYVLDPVTKENGSVESDIWNTFDISCDGSRIIYWCLGNNGPTFCISRSDGTGRCELPQILGIDDCDSWYFPAFSPTSQQIAFTCWAEDEEHSRIVVADYSYDGENCGLDNITQMTDPDTHQRVGDQYPQYSADGQFIVFSSGKMYWDEEHGWNWLTTIFKTSALGGESEYLEDLSKFTAEEIHDYTSEFYQRYKRDGQRIVFSRLSTAGMSLVTMDDDGGSEQVVYDDPFLSHGASVPSYSPDGNFVSFIGSNYCSEQDPCRPEVFAIPENGGPLDEMTHCDDPPVYYQVWAAAVRRLPLGDALETQKDPEVFKLYVPTRWGGKLEVTCAACTQVEIHDPHGEPFASRDDVGLDNQGFFKVEISGPVGSTVKNKFTQLGYANKRPWNFYWWSAKGDRIYDGDGDGLAESTACEGHQFEPCDDFQAIARGKPMPPQPSPDNPDNDIVRAGRDGILDTVPGPIPPFVGAPDEIERISNLYDVWDWYICDKSEPNCPVMSGAMNKYDVCTGLRSQCPNCSQYWETFNAWGTTHHRDEFGWTGHCNGAAAASILINQPYPDLLAYELCAQSSNVPTIDQLEGLWAELYTAPSVAAAGIGFDGVPCPGDPDDNPHPGFDNADSVTGQLHDALERVLLDSTVRWPLFTNLRHLSGCTVWNHAIYRYKSEMKEATPNSFPGDPLTEPRETVITATTTLWANRDYFKGSILGEPRPLESPDCSNPDPGTYECDCPRPYFGECLQPTYSRLVRYTYRMEYLDDGNVNIDPDSAYNDFILVEMYDKDESGKWKWYPNGEPPQTLSAVVGSNV